MKIINPYDGIDFSSVPKIKAITHEHIFRVDQLKSAYDRGIRWFANVHYQPSIPSVLHDGSRVYSYKDWSAMSDDANLVDRSWSFFTPATGGKTFIDKDGYTIDLDDLIQVGNAEHDLMRSVTYPAISSGIHHNVLGNLWGEAGVNVFPPITDMSWRRQHPIYTLEEAITHYRDEDNQQFVGRLFGTINHCRVYDAAKGFCELAPEIFKGFEIFNQGYSTEWNQEFRTVFDTLLQEGYRLWGTSVVDWQGDIAPWTYITDRERNYWISAYSALSDSQKSQYQSEFDNLDESQSVKTYKYGNRVEGYWYYIYNRECTFDRGCNILLIDGYDEMTTAEKEIAGLDAYRKGSFYCSGLGNHRITSLTVEGKNVTLSVDGTPSKIKAITAVGTSEKTGNTITTTIPKGTKFIRFEVYYYSDAADMDFILTQPIYIEGNEADNFGVVKKAFILDL